MLVSKNEKLNGIEITFGGIPSEETRNALKEKGFRWSRKQKIWWSRFTEDKYHWAQALTTDGMPFSILVSNSQDSIYKWGWYENTMIEYNMNQMPEIMMDELDWEQTTMKRSFYENMKTYCQQYDDTCQEYLKGLELVTIED